MSRDDGSAPAPPVRPSGRGVIVDPSGAVLFVQAEAADGSEYWFTPGGGIEPGEDPIAGTRREIAEETDLDLDTLGPVILRRRARLDFLGQWIEVDETFHAVELDARPAVRARHLEHYEAESFTGLVWMTPDEMRDQANPIYPACLPDLVEAFRAGSVSEPWIETDLHGDPALVNVVKHMR